MRAPLLIGVAVGVGHFAVFLLLYGVVFGAAMGGGEPGLSRVVLMTVGLPLMPLAPWAAMHGWALQLFVVNSAAWGLAGGLLGPRLWRAWQGRRLPPH